MYDWEMTEHERVEQFRRNYRELGLNIFESFEEYCESLDDDGHVRLAQAGNGDCHLAHVGPAATGDGKKNETGEKRTRRGKTVHFRPHLNVVGSESGPNGDIRRSSPTTEESLSRTKSTSSIVLYLESENLTDPWTAMNGTPIARMTWLGSSDPDAHAEPVEMQMPRSESLYAMASPSMYSNDTLSVFGRRFALSPLTRTFGHVASMPDSSLSRIAARASASFAIPRRASSQAFASPIMYGTFSVPARRTRS